MKLKKLIPAFMIFLSSIIGIRLFNLFFYYENRGEGIYINSLREFDCDTKLRVAHPIDYEIFSANKKTIIILSDSIGEGVHCGNQKNLAGYLAKQKEIKVVNLSARGTSPAFYFNQLKKYNSKNKFSNSNNFKNTFLFIIYSNDIVLDKEYCKFYGEIEASYQKFLPEEKFYLNKSCLKIESMNKLQYIKSKNIKNHIISKIIQTFIGEYSFLFFRELIAQLSFKLKINTDIGRVGYIKKWETYQNEAKLLGLLIKQSYDYCKKNNCNIEYFIFPNVENISKESSIRSAMLSFTNRIKKSYGINIYDGYEPFIQQGIIRANHSYIDIHPSCEAYYLYSEWLRKLIIK